MPSPAERLISTELGVWPNTVMLFALQTPELQQFDVEKQVGMLMNEGWWEGPVNVWLGGRHEGGCDVLSCSVKTRGKGL